MEEIKVEEYVRTKEYGIRKVIKQNIDCYIFDGIVIKEYLTGTIRDCAWLKQDKRLKDIKHSPDIIDLIEVGDFVNRREVIGKFIEDGRIVLILDTKLETKFIKNKVYEEDIRDIVTRQQFESMKYYVGGKEE